MHFRYHYSLLCAADLFSYSWRKEEALRYQLSASSYHIGVFPLIAEG
jgi:hypothetical protein